MDKKNHQKKKEAHLVKELFETRVEIPSYKSVMTPIIPIIKEFYQEYDSGRSFDNYKTFNSKDFELAKYQKLNSLNKLIDNLLRVSPNNYRINRWMEYNKYGKDRSGVYAAYLWCSLPTLIKEFAYNDNIIKDYFNSQAFRTCNGYTLNEYDNDYYNTTETSIDTENYLKYAIARYKIDMLDMS